MSLCRFVSGQEWSRPYKWALYIKSVKGHLFKGKAILNTKGIPSLEVPLYVLINDVIDSLAYFLNM